MTILFGRRYSDDVRLLFLLEGREVGGNETLLSSLLPYLAKQGFRPTLIVPKGKARQFLTPLVFQTYDVPTSSPGWETLFEKTSPDLCVGVHGDLPSFFAVSKRRRIPTLWMYGHPLFLSGWGKAETDLMSLLTDHVVSQSQYLKNSLPVDLFKNTVIPNRVDLNRFTPVSLQEKEAARVKLGFLADAFVLGYPARKASYKGHDSLLAWFRQLRSQFPRFQLLLLGVEGVEEPGIRSLSVSPSEVREYLAAVDVALFPSKNEGYGCAVAECLAMGLPTLIEKSGGHIEFREVGKEFFFESDPTVSLIQLLGSPTRRKQLQSRAIQFSRTLDRQKSLESYTKVFQLVGATRRETSSYCYSTRL